MTTESTRVDVTKAAVLDFAAHLMAERGYLGTSLVDVANKFEVTRQALYYHFPKKHDILFAIIDGVFQLLIAECEAILQDSPPETRFRQMLLAHGRVIAERPHWSAVVMTEDSHLPLQQREIVHEQRARFYSILADAYDAGVAAGTLKKFPSAPVVRVAVAPGNWLARWFRPDGKLTVDEVIEMLDATVFSGLSVGSADLD